MEEKHKRSLCRREQIGLTVTWEEDSCFCFWRTSTDCEAFTVVLHCSWIRVQGPLKDFFCISWEVNRAYIDKWNTVPFFHCCSSVFSLSTVYSCKWNGLQLIEKNRLYVLNLQLCMCVYCTYKYMCVYIHIFLSFAVFMQRFFFFRLT